MIPKNPLETVNLQDKDWIRDQTEPEEIKGQNDRTDDTKTGHKCHRRPKFEGRIWPRNRAKEMHTPRIEMMLHRQTR